MYKRQDILRDAFRGGAFSASGDDIRKSQGIGSGLGTLPNELVNHVIKKRLPAVRRPITYWFSG